MFNSVLTTDLREQAGSETYNRFEYQVHWIVYHMVEEIKKGNNFLVFCEFHDDMAKCDNCETPDKLEFYQVKTSGTKFEWKLNQLSSKPKKKKHSFIGFIFYNFMQFKEECKSCHFVSNIAPNQEIRMWQSIIRDGKLLKEEDLKLYNGIKIIIKNEFENIKDFEDIFDIFIQNTYVYNSELPLSRYEDIAKLEFLDLLSDKDIYISNGTKIFYDIVNDVRRKSKCKIKTPISFQELKQKKGISSVVLRNIVSSIEIRKDRQGLFEDIENYMKSIGKSLPYIRVIIRKLADHQKTMLNISNSYYYDSCNKIYTIIDNVIEENIDRIDEFDFVKKIVQANCSEIVKQNTSLTNILVEAMLYERLLSS